MKRAAACDLIESREHEALAARDWPAPYQPSAPVTFTVELAFQDHATVFYRRPGVELVNSRKVVARGDNFWELWDRFWYRK